MLRPILIFPAGMPQSVVHLKKCMERGRKVIGSSSLAYDPARKLYPSWVSLPYVTDPTFDKMLQELINELDIGQIFTPNFVVWNYLNEHLSRLAKGVTLENASPVDEVLGGYRSSLKKAKGFIATPIPLSTTHSIQPMPSLLELAGLCRYADLIPGMCDDEKLRVLLEIARHSTEGDIVEIGSWWGKSAFILAWAAKHFRIGKLLCVDPWSNAHLVQNEKIVDSGSAQVDADEALSVFQIGLLPFNANHINFLNMTSAEGAQHYASEPVIVSDHFGETSYRGKIAILHIDGNHAYDAVKTDIDAWSGFVVDGGWIVFDDYLWPYGDGPQRVGNEFLTTQYNRIETAFVMGGALFIRLAA